MWKRSIPTLYHIIDLQFAMFRTQSSKVRSFQNLFNFDNNSFKARLIGTGFKLQSTTSDNRAGKESTEDTSKLDVNSIIEELKAELTKANLEATNYKAKYTDTEDKYKRALADSENLRSRLTKQIQDQKLYAIQSFCKELTDIEDILRLAIDSVPKEKLDESKHLKELFEGIKMTEARLLQVFRSNGLTQINPINEKFNPNEHEAVMQKEEKGKESGTVLFVSKLGYKLHDRVIRPAVVGVAK